MKYPFSNFFDYVYVVHNPYFPQEDGIPVSGVAVDDSASPADPSSGDIYVADGTVVNKFTPASAASGSNTPDAQLTGFGYAWGVAVDPSDGDLYVTDFSGTVHKYDPEGNPVPSFKISGVFIENPTGVAVSPTNGNVYVATGNGSGEIYELDSDGAYTGNSYQGDGGDAAGLAVNSGGDLYFANGSEGTQEFTSPGSPPKLIDTSYSSGVAHLIASTGEIFVVEDPPQGSSVSVFGPSGNRISTFGRGSLGYGFGMGITETGSSVYVSDQDSNQVNLFNQVIVPDVTTGTVSSLRPSSVTLTGHLDPADSGEITGCHFEYTSGEAFRANDVNEVQTVAVSGASGSGNLVKGSKEITGLTTSAGTFAVGEIIEAPDLLAGTEVSAVEAGELELSNAAVATATVALSAKPAAGTFTLGFEGKTTAAIPYNASPAEVQTALVNLLSTIGLGSAVISGSNGGPYTIEFTGSLREANVPQLSADPTDLSPSGSMAKSATTTEGGNGWAIAASVPCEPATHFPNSTEETEVNAQLSGLSTETTYQYRLVADGGGGRPNDGQNLQFEPGPEPPVVSAPSAADLTPAAATLSSEVNPDFGPTVYRFEWGTSSSYGSATAFSEESIGADGTDHEVSTRISGLTPATTYHFRVDALNFSGLTEGPDQTFNTTDVPVIDATSSSALTQTTATLGATIRPGFSPTTYHFEYGTTNSYRQRTPESAPIGSDNSSHLAGAAISGLTPATTYHFRVVATNQVGPTDGPDQTFVTAPAEQTKPSPIKCGKKGFVLKHGKCVKKPHLKSKKKHRRRAAASARGGVR